MMPVNTSHGFTRAPTVCAQFSDSNQARSFGTKHVKFANTAGTHGFMLLTGSGPLATSK